MVPKDTGSGGPELTLDEAAALAPLIDAREAQARAAAGAVILDVRGPAAHERDGVLDGAIAVDRTTLEADFALGSADRVGELAADTPVIVACSTVRGSGPVAARMRELGYTNVVHVDGGVPAIRDIGDGEPSSA